MLIVCPSGMSFEARKWKIGDRRNVHDIGKIKQGLLFHTMLMAVDQGIVDPGPYDFKKGAKVPWDRVILRDLMESVLTIRKQMRPLLEFNSDCSSCGKQNELEADLNELEIGSLSDEALETLRSGEPHAVSLYCDDEQTKRATVYLRLLRGEDNKKIAKFQLTDPENLITNQMVMHIAKLQSEGGEELTNFNAIRRFYTEQDWSFHTALETAINDFAGGISTVVPFTCKYCGMEKETLIPLGVEFFYPKAPKPPSTMAQL